MSANTFGQRFCVTSFGESHGVAIGCVIDGCPAGLELSEQEIQLELNRRKPGTSKFTSQRKEPDTIQILSGLYEGCTTGTPIAMIIYNQQHRTKDYEHLKDVFRPGHADYTYFKKYGVYDYRGGGRASARETAVRVAAGAIAKKWLRQHRVLVRGYLAQMGDIKYHPEHFHWDNVNQNPFFCPDLTIVDRMSDCIENLRKKRDSIGAKVNIEAENIPPGLGEPVYQKLDALLAQALMSINAVKAVAIGDGFDVVEQLGSEHRDAMTQEGFLSNHAGGILAGISSGQTLKLSIALKPPVSIPQPVQTVDIENNPVQLKIKGRHDPCVGIRAVPVAEAMVALVLMDCWLMHEGAHHWRQQR